MRIMIDTNIFIFIATDRDRLTRNVINLIDDYDNVLCISTESLRELVVSFNNGGIVTERWKTAKEMLKSIREDYYIDVIPLDEHVMETYSILELNKAQEHKDPSDHVIISHAMTLGIPLISADKKFPFYKKQGLDLIEN